ncbi:hypothetical protein J6590_079587 [Homalodisca vitripennis]|nr:hypothetical protein J6590_079587 [Homalodisca vitripennis]
MQLEAASVVPDINKHASLCKLISGKVIVQCKAKVGEVSPPKLILHFGKVKCHRDRYCVERPPPGNLRLSLRYCGSPCARIIPHVRILHTFSTVGKLVCPLESMPHIIACVKSNTSTQMLFYNLRCKTSFSVRYFVLWPRARSFNSVSSENGGSVGKSLLPDLFTDDMDAHCYKNYLFTNHSTKCIFTSALASKLSRIGTKSQRVRRLSQDNQIKQRRAGPLLGQVTAERSCPCKRPACPAIGGGSEVTFKPLVPRLSVREGFLALTSPGKIRHSLLFFNSDDSPYFSATELRDHNCTKLYQLPLVRQYPVLNLSAGIFATYLYSTSCSHLKLGKRGFSISESC